jgi:endoglucanase
VTTSTRRPSPEPGRRRARSLQVGVVVIALAIAQFVLGPIEPAPVAASGSPGPPVVRVSGNKLVNGAGTPIRLIGFDHSGSESACVAGSGFFYPSDSDTPSMIATMKSWKINAVRLPLNEDCWLGINLPHPQFGGAAYRSAIVNYVTDLNAAGLAVILDLHWSAPGRQLATGQAIMADEDHSPTFWSSVAATFRGHQGVVFDLFNEPQYLPLSCLVHGGCVEKGFKVAGYNQLIADVRATGATNVIMVAGLDFAANPTGFSTDMPFDSRHQLAISVHVYNFNAAKRSVTWDHWVNMGLLSKVPFVTGELGETDCTAHFIDTYMSWADAHGVSYLAWTFNSGSCPEPRLINSSGNPTAYGAGYKDHLAHIVVRSLGG